MISSIALTLIFGYPAIMYGGLLTLALLISQIFMGHRITTGKCRLKNPIKWHKVGAGVTLAFALIHGLLGLSIFMGF